MLNTHYANVFLFAVFAARKKVKIQRRKETALIEGIQISHDSSIPQSLRESKFEIGLIGTHQFFS